MMRVHMRERLQTYEWPNKSCFVLHEVGCFENVVFQATNYSSFKVVKINIKHSFYNACILQRILLSQSDILIRVLALKPLLKLT